MANAITQPAYMPWNEETIAEEASTAPADVKAAATDATKDLRDLNSAQTSE